jgi:hypothetical protein
LRRPLEFFVKPTRGIGSRRLAERRSEHFSRRCQLANESRTTMPLPILVPISPGDLFDRITILDIKSRRINDPDKLRNVHTEHAALVAVQKASIVETAYLASLVHELQAVNESLWDVEDRLRECERSQDFGPRFIELARSVYKYNDHRAKVKRQINEALGSDLVEEKSYSSY